MRVVLEIKIDHPSLRATEDPDKIDGDVLAGVLRGLADGITGTLLAANSEGALSDPAGIPCCSFKVIANGRSHVQN